MPTRSDIAKLKKQLIGKSQDKLLTMTSGAEKALVDAILNMLFDELGKGETIQDENGRALKLSKAVEKVFEHFNNNKNLDIIREMAIGIDGLTSLNNKYFAKFSEDRLKRYDKVFTDVENNLRARLGIGSAGAIVKGGYFDRLLNDTGLKNKVTDITRKATTQQWGVRDLVGEVRKIIVGTPETTGGLTQHYRQFAYDTFAQYDRAIGAGIATGLGLRTFIYEGGLIETSREFCKKKSGKVFTIEEAEQWKFDKDLLLTKDEKNGGVLQYNPIDDMGRWGCRHTASWIDKDLAIRMRPELKTYFDNIEQTVSQARTQKATQDTIDPEEIKNAKLTRSQQKTYSEFPRQPVADRPSEELQELAIKTAVVKTQELLKKYMAGFTTKTGVKVDANGNVINTDDARKLFIDIGYNGTNANEVHEASSYISKLALKELLKSSDKKIVSYYAGGAGSCKTSTIETLLPKIKESSAAIIDGNMAKFAKAVQGIEASLSAGKTVEIAYVYRDPVDAWSAVISRMLHNPSEMGRAVKSSTFLETTIGSYNTVKEMLKSSLASNPNVKIHLFDNSLGKGNARAMSVEKFMRIQYPNNLKKLIREVTDGLYKSGEISKSQYETLIQ